MPIDFRQKNDAVRILRVLVLCLTTLVLAGFSKPVLLVKSSVDLPHRVDEVEAEAIIKILSQSVSTLKPVDTEPARRPGSFATGTLLNPVLGEVSHRQWVKPAHYSPDRALAELQGRLPEAFHGVGFPDIRTHRKTERLVSFTLGEPSNWSPMIAWRDSEHNDQLQEPIAHVRCMGLSPQAVARRADRFESLMLTTALEYNVSVSLIKAIVTEESCFNSQAVSPVGAQGLMQLMPDTALWLKVSDPLDPLDNLRAGARYIAALQKQFDTLELALAAYNAGPGNVRRYKGVPPFAETQAYVQKVQAHYRRYVAANRIASR